MISVKPGTFQSQSWALIVTSHKPLIIWKYLIHQMAETRPASAISKIHPNTEIHCLCGWRKMNFSMFLHLSFIHTFTVWVSSGIRYKPLRQTALCTWNSLPIYQSIYSKQIYRIGKFKNSEWEGTFETVDKNYPLIGTARWKSKHERSAYYYS